MGRPSFNEAWSAFGKVNFPVADVGRIIGGNVGQNISGGYFENACPIRMSYVLNATGFPISRSSPYATVSGSDKKFYIYRVNDMIERKRLVRTVLIFTESSDQLSRATDRVPGLPASPGYVQ